MLGKLKPENLPTYLTKIDRLFPEFKQGIKINNNDISDYYKQSFWGYAVFHSWAGAIHMALSKGEHFSKADYFVQAKEAETEISQLKPFREQLSVLEVGCGRGFNLRYLSHRFPEARLTGIDLSERNIKAAKRDLARCSNVETSVADFNDLSEFSDGSFDAVLAVETLCHSSDFHQTLSSIARVVRTGGKLIVFDGFRGENKSLSADLTHALEYTEKAMAVHRFSKFSEFQEAAQANGFEISLHEDRSKEIMPNLIRLSDFAKTFFKIDFLSRALMLVLPRGLVANSVAGLLMAVTVSSGAHSYRKLIFTRK